MKKLNKKEIKSYSNQILKTCKLWGYDGEDERFENFFDDEKAFYFIPCYKEGVESCVDEEELEDFIERFGLIVDEIICEANKNDVDVEVTLEEAENFAKENHDSLGKYFAIRLDADSEDVINWLLDNCDKQTKEKFLKWVLE